MSSPIDSSFWPQYMNSANDAVALPELDAPGSKKHQPTPLDPRRSSISPINALSEPQSPINKTSIEIEITPASPTVVRKPRARSGNLKRSGVRNNIAADALAENNAGSFSSGNDPQPCDTPPAPTITARPLPIPRRNLLVVPPSQQTLPARLEHLSPSDIVSLRQINDLPRTPTCQHPFGPRFAVPNGNDRWLVTPVEIRTLAECSGESQIWTLNVEDVFCDECVQESTAKYNAEYGNHIERYLETNPEVLKAYLLLRNRHHPGPCQHPRSIAHLMQKVGKLHCSRIKNIRLTSSSSESIFLSASLVASAISIIIQCFPNLQHATVELPRATSDGVIHRKAVPLIADGLAVRLARSFALLEKHLPAEEGLKIEGLEGEVVLQKAWMGVKRGWWERKRAFGRKVLH